MRINLKALRQAGVVVTVRPSTTPTKGRTYDDVKHDARHDVTTAMIADDSLPDTLELHFDIVGTTPDNVQRAFTVIAETYGDDAANKAVDAVNMVRLSNALETARRY